MRRNLEETRQFIKGDRFGVHCGIEVDEVGEGYARCHMDVKDHHLNINNFVMGGATFTLADLCYGVASDFCGVSMTSEINFLAPAKGPVLYADCHVIKDGRSTVFAETIVTDSDGKKVAVATITGFKTK